MTTRVLISGAGIAGEALALLLTRQGLDVTVVERADELRTGGQSVDLRGAGRTVVERLGLLPAARERAVSQRGIAWVDRGGSPIAAMPVEAFGGRGFVSSDELLRGDLVTLLHDAVGPDVEYLMGDTITAMEETADGVRVDFERAESASYDLVVGADGVHSAVRRLTFGPEQGIVRPLGLVHAWFTVPAATDLDGWFLVHNAPGSRVASLRPARTAEQQKAGLSARVPQAPRRGDRDAQHRMLEDTFRDVGWQTPYLLEQARAAHDFSLDSYDQVHMDQWARGRVVLLGDAAWCPSPLSGMGTALALVGAYVLAGELTRPTALTPATISTAAAQWTELVRPHVQRAQRLPPGRVASYAPRTERGIRFAAATMRAVQTRPVAALIDRLADRERSLPLPHYEGDVSVA